MISPIAEEGQWKSEAAIEQMSSRKPSVAPADEEAAGRSLHTPMNWRRSCHRRRRRLQRSSHGRNRVSTSEREENIEAEQTTSVSNGTVRQRGRIRLPGDSSIDGEGGSSE
ncbi:hypothetical protein SASPL_150509 [Salvia splendens]|uniref:Uncharacterized protein n=1 Tax=Salvia splendens TaxID=180675 RepID=A0A8X8W6P4_SALSN|nr:hypothetical protein SASPL_150509 [Salvia splendens]